MVILLFTAIFILGILALTLFLWAPSAKRSEQSLLPPPAPPRGLFSDTDGFESTLLTAPAVPNDPAPERTSLMNRAMAGDKGTLIEAHALGDRRFYDAVLDQLAERADRDPTLLALISYVTRNDLPVNRTLATAVISSWKNAPDRSSTSTTLHLTALADDADLYQSTVEAALSVWRQGLLADVSAAELRALIDGEYWVLSALTRSSGAGFVLKRTLANARRELETAMKVS
ncbi:MAG: hypothetical protein ABI967_07215 [bacterium]